MPKSPHKHAMYIEDTKMYLNSTSTAELAKQNGIHQSTVDNRIAQTIHKLINYYNLKSLEGRFFNNMR